MTARLSTLLIWALVAASAVYWGQRLFTRPTPVPAGATVAAAPLPSAGSLARLLGTPPPKPVQPEAQAPPADNRFRLVGVVAPRGAASAGLALISVDGKPPRAWAVGRELEPGLRLLSVNHRQVEIGAARGAAAITLALPPLAEAQRGRPGEPMVPVAPGMPGAMPGAFPGGMPAYNRAAAGVMLRPPVGAPMPGAPIQDQAESPEPGNAPLNDGGPPTR